MHTPTDQPDHPVDLPYAKPVERVGPRVWAGSAITLAGLALIVLGGCFLIGVMLTLSNGFAMPQPLTQTQYVFVGVLTALAFACFAASAWILVTGLAGLFRVLRG